MPTHRRFVPNDRASHVFAQMLDLFLGGKHSAAVGQAIDDDAAKLDDGQTHGHTPNSRD